MFKAHHIFICDHQISNILFYLLAIWPDHWLKNIVSIFLLKLDKTPWTFCEAENPQIFKDFKETKMAQPQQSIAPNIPVYKAGTAITLISEGFVTIKWIDTQKVEQCLTQSKCSITFDITTITSCLSRPSLCQYSLSKT